MPKLNNFDIKLSILALFRKLKNIISSYTATTFEKKLIKKSLDYPFCRTHECVLWENIQIFNKIKKNIIDDSSIVECGVETGHSLVFFQHLLENYKIYNVMIYGYDTFEGVPEPSDNDIDSLNIPMKIEYQNRLHDDGKSGWNNVSLEEVKKNFVNNTSEKKDLKLIKGKVEDTLLNDENLPKKIFILKLDAPLYEATKIELEKLYPKIQKGGVCIIDNYGTYKGIKKAVDEYFKNKNIKLNYSKLNKRMTIFV
mgnify:CR=1 FL=1